MKHKVYIDGQAGTTGLQLRQKLQNHKDVEICENYIEFAAVLQKNALIIPIEAVYMCIVYIVYAIFARICE